MELWVLTLVSVIALRMSLTHSSLHCVIVIYTNFVPKVTFMCLLFWCYSALKMTIKERRNTRVNSHELLPVNVNNVQSVATGPEHVRVGRADISNGTPEITITYPPPTRTSRRYNTLPSTRHTGALRPARTMQGIMLIGPPPPQVRVYVLDIVLEQPSNFEVKIHVIDSQGEHLSVSESAPPS